MDHAEDGEQLNRSKVQALLCLVAEEFQANVAFNNQLRLSLAELKKRYTKFMISVA